MVNFWSKGVGRLFEGILVLGLSIVIWRLTGNYWGWLALFLPGAFLTTYGVYLVFREEHT
jgi:hypothetical protein